MPKLVRLYIVQSAAGFGLAGLLVALLLACDVGGLGHLVLTSPDGVLAALMLWVANGVVFAGVQFGIAIMSMADDTDGPHRGEMIPIPIRVRDDRRA